MNRRQFLVRSSATVGALITSQLLKDAQWLITNEAKPLLIPPRESVTETLYAAKSEGHYALFLGGLPNEYNEPQLSWAQFCKSAWGSNEPEAIEFLQEHCSIERQGAVALLGESADADLIFNHWCRHWSPNALAYKELERLDLGTHLSKRGVAGEIDLIDGFHPGNDTLWVQVPDLLSLSLLQGRLNELDAAIRVEMLDPNTDWGLG